MALPEAGAEILIVKLDPLLFGYGFTDRSQQLMLLIGAEDGEWNCEIVDQGGYGWCAHRGAPAFPSLYVGIAAALQAGILA